VRREAGMSTNVLTIPYSDDLLLSMKRRSQEFEIEAKLLLAVKLYEMERVYTDAAAKLTDMSREAFMLELARFGLSPMGQQPVELAGDLANA
jgi:predicted HTH domain antitoxin